MINYLPPTKIRELDELRALSAETEWVEFKENNHHPRLIGEWLSALSNSARLKSRPVGILVYGIEDGTHDVKGTSFDPYQVKGEGNEDLIPWLTRGLEPRMRLNVEQGEYQGKHVIMLEVQAAANRPVKFYGQAFVRAGSSKQPLANHPELERALWHLDSDWSAEHCKGAKYHHLDATAILMARDQFKKKHPRQAADVDGWDDRKFLTKARVAIEGELTNTAILLLGTEDAEPLLNPSQAWLRWSLKKPDGSDENYEDFRTPFLLNVDRLFRRIRNLRVRAMPDGTLFPIELDQYDPWVIREALHNAIAHQDYSKRGRVLVVEKPDELIFSNVGEFLPGSVEDVIREDVPPRVYRNPWLCQAMVNLGMIDTQGGGIRRMFVEQKRRSFPMPDYDLGYAGEVRVIVPGKVLDVRYTRLLIERPDLDLDLVIWLDRVQKGQPITRDEYKELRRRKLVEGRWNAVHIAADVAASVGSEAEYIKMRGLDRRHYEKLVEEYLQKFDSASREDIDLLLLEKLPDVLTEKQKRNRIHNLLTSMRQKQLIYREGGRSQGRWRLGETPLLEIEQ